MANKHHTIYVGVTNHLLRRVFDHKHRAVTTSFTAKYGLDRLVYVEQTSDVHAAIEREKQIKGWLRSKKVALIESLNPRWEDLAAGWYEAADPSPSLGSGSG